MDTHDFVIRMKPEPDHDGPHLMAAFDEIVIGPNDGIHIERLDDNMYWMAVSKGGKDQRIVISSITGRAKIVARTEAD